MGDISVPSGLKFCAQMMPIKLPWEAAVMATGNGGRLSILKFDCEINMPITVVKPLQSQVPFSSPVAAWLRTPGCIKVPLKARLVVSSVSFGSPTFSLASFVPHQKLLSKGCTLVLGMGLGVTAHSEA